MKKYFYTYILDKNKDKTWFGTDKYKPTSLERIQFLVNKRFSKGHWTLVGNEAKKILLVLLQGFFSIEDSCEILNAIQIHNNTKILPAAVRTSHTAYYLGGESKILESTLNWAGMMMSIFYLCYIFPNLGKIFSHYYWEVRGKDPWHWNPIATQIFHYIFFKNGLFKETWVEF